MTSVSALVSGLDAELRRLGYEDSTMKWYRGAWRRMGRYFAARGVREFSLDVAMAWVDEACGFFANEQAGTLKQTDVYLFRVAQMLEDYAVHGAVLRRYNRSVRKLDGPGAEAIARFQAHLRAAGRSALTVRTYGTLAGEFAAFTGTRGGLACCDAAMVGAFAATLAGYQGKTVEQKLCAVRSFLRFASEAGLVDAACLDAVPAARSARQARIPSVWDPGEVARIVEAIDRDNPCGKRDYAIILLITRLGLRGADIRRLEFTDFDWPGNRLLVTQAKTSHPVQLPLLKEVGWAVIGYIRHGRPHSDCPQVFLRHLAPIGPFSDQDHLHQILVTHARVAHVLVSDKRRHGMHLLRPGLEAPTRASAEAWITSARARGVQPATLHGLAAPVRELARWLGRRGVSAYVLPAGTLPRPARYVPHIYTDQELAALFAQTGRCHYDSQVPFRHLVMPVLFRTICACGLRACEARLLRFGDVDLDTGVLTIRDGKGGKDRQVPVSALLRERLADYHARVAGRTGADWFFPSRPGQPLTLMNINRNFRRFLWQARIPHGGRGHGPRVHDLRHVFAVNNLRSWFASGEDAGALLPVLQAYMGHASIAGTSYYLRLTAESYPHLTTRVQHAFGDIVPPVTAGPCHGD